MRMLPTLTALSALLSFGALAQSGSATTVVGSRIVGESRYDVSATVESIDRSSRQVLLRREDGSFLTFRAAPQVRNFAQVKAGDVVQATVAETLWLTLTRGAEPPSGTAEGVLHAPEGARPGIAEIEAARIVGGIEAVDQTGRTIGVRTPDGVVRQIQVPNDVNIAQIQPGDSVSLTLVRRAAVVVRPAPPGQ